MNVVEVVFIETNLRESDFRKRHNFGDPLRARNIWC